MVETVRNESQMIGVLALLKHADDPLPPFKADYVGLFVDSDDALKIINHDGTISSPFIAVEKTYGGSADEQGHSFQPVAADLTLDPLAGSSDGGNPKYLAAAMFNLLADSAQDSSRDANYLGGVIGAYSIPGTKKSTYPVGAVLAQITDGVTEADGAVVAYIDGDGSVTTAGAAFKVKNNNSNAASGFDFGLDLQDAAHDGYQPVDMAFYLKAELRITEDVCVKVITGAPVDGGAGTGVGVMGPGSLVVSISTAKLYINTNTKASPTWVVVGSQS